MYLTNIQIERALNQILTHFTQYTNGSNRL